MLGWFQTWDVIKGYDDPGHVFIACASERDEERSDEFEMIKSNHVSMLTIGTFRSRKVECKPGSRISQMDELPEVG